MLLAALLAGLAVVLCFRLGAGPLHSEAETRVWDVTRGMHATGDWLVPHQNGVVRLNKPPLYYWSVASLARVAGAPSLALLRLPAALATLALVWVTWRWARRLGGPRLGLLAAALLACMTLVGTQGRTGVAEMFLALFVTLGLFTLQRLAAAPAPGPVGAARHRRLLPQFALWLALATLSKATVALLLLGVPALLLAVMQERRVLRPSGRVLAWVALGLAGGFAWHALVLLSVPGAFDSLRAALLLPFGVRVDGVPKAAAHLRGVHFFVPALVVAAVPVAVLLPTLLARAVRSRLWRGERVRFAGLSFVALFVCFSLVPQKQTHYLLPLLPMFAILCAESVLALQARAPAALRRLLVALAALAALLAVPALLVLHLVYVEALGLPLVAGAAVGLAAAVLLGCLLRAARAGALGAFAGIGTAGVLLLLLCYHGSLELWTRQFESGEVRKRPDFVAARWQPVLDDWPLLEAALRARARDD